MSANKQFDGINGMVARGCIVESARKLRDTYSIVPDAPIFQNEFGFFSFERWEKEGFLEKGHDAWDLDWNDYLRNLFGFDRIGHHALMGMSWGTAAFSPWFEEKIIEDRGEYEVVQDTAGRYVLFFKGRRNGFMPEYLEHPVKDMKTWMELCEWRLNSKDPARYVDLNEKMNVAVEKAKQGYIIEQMVTGGYMYLRSLMGPVELLYKFYDEPELIHTCMQNWLELADTIISKHQEHVTIDELFLSEDICYNKGPLISPDMIREFLFPYYQQLIENIKRRQIDKNRHLYVQVDSDGFCEPIIKLYQKIGMDYLSPFEVASGCDVVRIGQEYPELIIRGGIDKRMLAEGKEAIDRHLDYILPAMKKRGGYIPTCDHGVPEEVSFENYMHYRKRCLEYSK